MQYSHWWDQWNALSSTVVASLAEDVQREMWTRRSTKGNHAVATLPLLISAKTYAPSSNLEGFTYQWEKRITERACSESVAVYNDNMIERTKLKRGHDATSLVR